jgi:hypothetical protein
MVLGALGATLSTASGGASEAPQCAAEEVEYALNGNLKLSDTPMGRGDGTYPIGPGKIVLRFEGNEVTMRSLTMTEHFKIHVSAIFWTGNVVTDVVSTATPNRCSVAAEGTLEGHSIHWRTPVSGYRTEGTLTCDGSICGEFGAPPSGRSAFRLPPRDATFRSFVFAPDMKTFTMAATPAVHTEQPKQTSEVAMSGREMSRRCVEVTPCSVR